ncbi:MAG: thiamine phosphate synthase [Bacteroidota bacterium]
MVIVISNPTAIADEHAIIEQLFDEGLEIFHVRKKEFSENEMRTFIERISEKYFSKIVLHSHYSLVKEYDLKGIHVPVDFKNEASKGTLSVSFHSLDEVEKFENKFDYGFLSPVFDSISKEGYKRKFDFSELKMYFLNRKVLNNRTGNGLLIALGGIDEDKIEKVKELGFSGIALLGAIWKSENPVEKFKRIKEQWLKKELMY